MARRHRTLLLFAATAIGSGVAWLAWCRYVTFHNETFDLALYTRMAWGFAHRDGWEPIVGASFWGIHVSPVLAALGLVGRLCGTVRVLLVAQVAAAMAAAWPLARMGQRRFGPVGALAAAAVWLLQPNLGHVLTYEFHPGTLAVLPLAWGLDALDRRDVRALLLSVLGVLVCREDGALVTALLGLVAVGTAPSLRRAGFVVAVCSVGYFLFFALVLQPQYAPEYGSLQAHFGNWGQSLGDVLYHVLSDPSRLLAHLAAEDRLLYLPTVLAPLAFFPLLRPRLAFVCAAPVAVNLLSQWPDTIQYDSHYQTMMLPALVAAGLDGARALPERARVAGLCVLVTASVSAHVVAGGTPLAADFEWDAFRRDERSAAAESVIAKVPARASVQAPYSLVPHLAERAKVHVAPPPERQTDYVVLDAWNREEWARHEDLLRTTEEPLIRDWLARQDYGLVAAEGPYLLLARGAPPRSGLLSRYFVGRSRRPEQAARLSACMGLRDAWVDGDDLVLEVVARGPCPSDLAIRIGSLFRPVRVDLLFDGLLSPAHLRYGDRLVSRHRFGRDERERWGRLGVRVGLIRSSGARPDPSDPSSVPVPLPREAFLRAGRNRGSGTS